jgi:serine/threonine protein kinase
MLYPSFDRDIKPENFMLNTKGDSSNVKMIDFGLSKDYSNLKTMTTMSGSVSSLLLISSGSHTT